MNLSELFFREIFVVSPEERAALPLTAIREESGRGKHPPAALAGSVTRVIHAGTQTKYQTLPIWTPAGSPPPTEGIYLRSDQPASLLNRLLVEGNEFVVTLGKGFLQSFDHVFHR